MPVYLLDTHIWFWLVRGREGRLTACSWRPARLRNAVIVTRDKRILKYGKQGHVKVMAA